MNEGERLTVEFFDKRGLRAERFLKSDMRQRKTPDFRVYRGSELVSYAEAKDIRHDDWLDKRLKAAQPLQLAGGMRQDPVFNRLTDRIHEAAKQFQAVNAQQHYPNVLLFANSDRHCGIRDLIAVLEGNFYADSGAVEPIYKQYSEGRIREEKRTIDLYVWCDCWLGSENRERLYFNSSSQHYGKLCDLLGSDPARHVRIPSA